MLSVVVAVVENRAREVCLSTLSAEAGSQVNAEIFQDSQSYAETLAHLVSLSPTEILLHDGSRGRVLSLKITEAFLSTSHELTSGHQTRVLFVNRQYFDQDRGAEMLKRVSWSVIECTMLASYTFLSATYCLLKYVENVSGRNFTPQSLKISLQIGNKTRMLIERKSAAELELIANARTGDHRRSLFGIIKGTKTAIGSRLLRREILSPCTHLPTIQERLDAVSFFLSHEEVFEALCMQLSGMPDLDRLLGGLVAVPRAVNAETAGQGVATVLGLRHALKLVEPLSVILEGGLSSSEVAMQMRNERAQYEHSVATLLPGCSLITAILDNLRAPQLKIIERDVIGPIFSDSSKYSKGSTSLKNQECFAVKSGIDGMLDLARHTYFQCVQDIHQLAETYAREYPDAAPRVQISSTRGYFLQLPSNVTTLPDIYIQCIKNVKTISCTTVEVSSLSDRAREALNEALILTSGIVQGVMAKIREDMDSLFAMVESIALLDLIQGFARLVASSNRAYCKPQLVAAGPLSISKGYHPITGSLMATTGTTVAGGFVANDVTLTLTRNILIITGANGTGKTTLLKQIAIIVVLAQIGCFVPCESAIIPVRDSILTRISTGDDAENNLSSFQVEMMETKRCLEAVTSRSLVLVDELGRGTSTAEGCALAWSVCEAMASSPAYTLVVTHYPLICKLSKHVQNIVNVHLQTGKGDYYGEGDGSNAHAIADGPADALKVGYGIQTAQGCGFPIEIVKDANLIRDFLVHNHETKQHFELSAPRVEDEDDNTNDDDGFTISDLHSLAQLLSLLGKASQTSLEVVPAGLKEIDCRITTEDRMKMLESVPTS